MQGLFSDSEGWVRVRFSDGRELDMTKERYVAQKRQPPLHELPIRNDLLETATPPLSRG